MSKPRLILTTILVLNLASSTAVAEQTDACRLISSPLPVGADPIDYARLALRQDRRPVLAYSNAVHNSASLYFYDCADLVCATGHFVYLDTSTNYFGASGIVVRKDGRPAIVAGYLGGVRFYDCRDADCQSVYFTDIRPMFSAIFSDMPVVLQPNGNPVFLYVDGFMSSRPLALIAHFCADVDCSAAGTEQVLAIPPDMSGIGPLSLAIDSDGFLAVSYLTSEGASTLNAYYLARCSDASCSMVTNMQISVPVGSSTPTRTAVAIRSDQRPLALDSQASNIALLDCATRDCAMVTDRPLPAGAAGLPLGLKLMPGDLPAFALFNPLTVGAFACADAACFDGVAVQTSSTATRILDADFAIDASSRPIIAYIDADTGSLAVTGCDAIFSDGFD